MPTSRLTHKALALLALTSAASLAGCSGKDWEAETYPVTGKVLINGEPAVDAIVELHATAQKPDSRNSRPWGIVQPDGSFSLTTYQKADGAPPGQYAVTLRWPVDLTTPSQVDRLAGAYSTAAKAPANVTVEAGENEIPAIDLKDVKVLAAEKAVRSRPRMKGPGPMPGKK